MPAASGRFFCLAILLGASPLTGRTGELTANVTALSDFRFRGVSLSDRDPALQAGLDWSHASGAMAGALASTVRPEPSEEKRSGIAGQGYLGWSAAWSQAVTWSGGLALYAFPHQPEVGSLDYQELFLRLRAQDLDFGLAASNSYFGSGAPSAYFSATAGQDLSDRLRVFAHAGWLWTGAADSGDYYDRAQRLDARLGAQFDLRWASLEVSVVGATTGDNWCRANHKACEPGVVLAVRTTF